MQYNPDGFNDHTTTPVHSLYIIGAGCGDACRGLYKRGALRISMIGDRQVGTAGRDDVIARDIGTG